MNQSLVNQVALSYLGGVVGFLSLCLVPSLIAYLSFLIGSSTLAHLQGRGGSVFRTALVFAFGFSLAFALAVIPSPVQIFLVDAYHTTARITGVASIAFGMALLSINKRAPLGWPVPLIFGALFGVVWPYCVGPILEILIGISLKPWSAAQGASLLFVYVLGFATVFLLAGLALSRPIESLLNRISKERAEIIAQACGMVLLAMGVSLVFSGLWLALNRVFVGLSHNSPVLLLEELLIDMLR